MNGILRFLEDTRRYRRLVVMVLGIAFLTRFAVLVAFWPSWGWHENAIPDQWNELAINLVEHRTFAFSDSPDNPTVLRGPFFPWLEVPLYLVFGENYAGWVIVLLLYDVLSCFVLIVTIRRLWGPRPSLLAGLLYAVNLPIIYYTCKIMQLTSITLFVVIWLYLISFWERHYFCRWVPLVTGLVSGLMILNKSVYLPVPLVSAALLLWLNRSKIRRLMHAAPVVLYLLVTFVIVAPWTIRNYVVTNGHLVPVQNMFWELMVQDVVTDELDAAVGTDRPEGQLLKYWIDKADAIAAAAGLSLHPPPGRRGEWEMQREVALRGAFFRMLKDDPWKILRAKADNVWQFWILAENRHKTRLFLLMQSVPLSAAVIGLLVLCRFRQLNQIVFGLALIAVIWGEHCLVWGWGRLSLDLTPVLAVIFGLGVHLLVSRQVREGKGVAGGKFGSEPVAWV
jgi:4-amino-4-deoxy-L-arabinose transferase-like glycosyltransferase